MGTRKENFTRWKLPTLWFWRRGLVFGQIHLLPVAVLDSCPNLDRRFLLPRLFVSVDPLSNADIANRGVLTDETVEQALVSDAAVAVTVARLLVQDSLDLGGERIGILHEGVFKQSRSHGFGHGSPRNLGVIGRDGFVGFPGALRGRGSQIPRHGKKGDACQGNECR